MIETTRRLSDLMARCAQGIEYRIIHHITAHSCTAADGSAAQVHIQHYYTVRHVGPAQHLADNQFQLPDGTIIYAERSVPAKDW